MLKIGDIAPNFTAKSLDGDITLESLKGKSVILYFYPKDDTPGCTTEAKAFSTKIEELEKLNGIVLGVSKDTIDCHVKFKNKYDLKVNLVTDDNGEICDKYGVWVQKSFLGKKYMGIERATFLINKEGKISYIWPKVSVVGHVNEVIQKLTEIK